MAKKFFALFIFAAFFFFSLPVSAQTTLPGDANSDGKVDDLDYVIWINHYGSSNATGPSQGDFNNDQHVDDLDYVIWSNNYGKVVSVTPTRAPTSTPTPKITAVPSPLPTPTSLPSSTSGIWISASEIAQLPTSGSAWDRLNSAANSSWGTANLGDNNSQHDTYTLAGALVAARANDTAMRNKTIAGLQSAMVSPLTRALELSRGLQSYIIAADIINYRTPEFEAWVRKMINADVSPHTGGSSLCNSSSTSFSCSGVGGVICTAYRSANNWGGHARASLAAAALYLKDQALLANVANTYKSFIGLSSPNHLYCESTNWHASSSEKFGENRKGSAIQGQDVSGVLPEDWRRGSEFQWPPTLTGYMWEGMQGYVVTAVLLHRAGLVPFGSGDNAVVRAMDILYRINNPPSGDDTWIPWVVNHYAGTSYPTVAAVAGKNMGWTDWTHQ